MAFSRKTIGDFGEIITTVFLTKHVSQVGWVGFGNLPCDIVVPFSDRNIPRSRYDIGEDKKKDEVEGSPSKLENCQENMNRPRKTRARTIPLFRKGLKEK